VDLKENSIFLETIVPLCLNLTRRIFMPANLPPQYYELEREFKKEQDPKEKLRLAQELLAMMPKHKGTDKLQAELKAKISKLKEQIEAGHKKHGARRTETHDHFEREGAGQATLIGPPNSGKSTLLGTLTHAKPIIADYPFATREPIAGMMPFDTIQIQLIDTPSIAADFFESYMANLVRQTDLVLLVADVTSPSLIPDLDIVFQRLEEKRIKLAARMPSADEDPRFAYKRTLVVAHKATEEDDAQAISALKSRFPDFRMALSTILDDRTIIDLKRAIFESLGIIRVFTKKIGHEAVFEDPIILPIGGTIEMAAETIHKDFARRLQFAKVWGQGKFEGQRVKGDFILHDGDVVEFHI
jgi:ribosome-interacting GTPase 1